MLETLEEFITSRLSRRDLLRAGAGVTAGIAIMYVTALLVKF